MVTSTNLVKPSSLQTFAILFSVVVAGFAGLCLQVIGPRFLIPSFGSTHTVLASVLTVSLLGLATGYYFGGKNLYKVSTVLPVVFLLSGLSFWILSIISWPLARGLASSSVFSLLLVCVLLFLVPSVLLGSVSTQAVALLNSFKSKNSTQFNTGLVFGIGTFANVAGGLTAGFYLVPFVGLSNSMRLLGLLLGLCSLLLLFITKSSSGFSSEVDAEDQQEVSEVAASDLVEPGGINRRNPKLLLALAFSTGFISLAYEVAAPRIMASQFGVSPALWGSILAVALGGLAAGYLVGGFVKSVSAPRVLVKVFVVNAFLMLVSLWTVLSASSGFQERSDTIVVVTFLAFVMPFFLFGLEAQLVITILTTGVSRRRASQLTGTTFAVSTVGALLGALSGVFFLASTLGHSFFVRTLAIAYCALAFVVVANKSRVVYTGLALAVLAVFPLPDWKWDSPFRLLAQEEGRYQTIRVYTDDATFKRMHLNLQYSSESDFVTGEPTFQYAGDLLGLLGDTSGKSVVVIGGAGHALANALEGQGANVTIAELDPGVIEVSDEFFGRPEGEIVIGDGRQYISGLDTDSVDVVVIDAFEGPSFVPAHLLTSEFFSEVDRVLNTEGVMAMNYIGSTLSPGSDSYDSVAATIKASFKESGRVGEDGNILFFAGSQPLDSSLVPLESVLPVLTDDKNPIDVYAMRFRTYWINKFS